MFVPDQHRSGALRHLTRSWWIHPHMDSSTEETVTSSCITIVMEDVKDTSFTCGEKTSSSLVKQGSSLSELQQSLSRVSPFWMSSKESSNIKLMYLRKNGLLYQNKMFEFQKSNCRQAGNGLQSGWDWGLCNSWRPAGWGARWRSCAGTQRYIHLLFVSLNLHSWFHLLSWLTQRSLCIFSFFLSSPSLLSHCCFFPLRLLVLFGSSGCWCSYNHSGIFPPFSFVLAKSDFSWATDETRQQGHCFISTQSVGV